MIQAGPMADSEPRPVYAREWVQCNATSKNSTPEGAERNMCDASRGEIVPMAYCRGCRKWHCVGCHASRQRAITARATIEKRGGLTPFNGDQLDALVNIDWAAAVSAGAAFEYRGVVVWDGTLFPPSLAWTNTCPWCYDITLPTPTVVLPSWYATAPPHELVPGGEIVDVPSALTIDPRDSSMSSMRARFLVRTFYDVGPPDDPDYNPDYDDITERVRGHQYEPVAFGTNWEVRC